MTETKQQKLDKIYEEIADKTLSFGCRIRHKETGGITKIVHSYGEEIELGGVQYIVDVFKNIPLRIKTDYNFFENWDIIGHPVMINRVDWYFITNNRDDLRIQLEIEDLIKPVEGRPENKINQLYDNLLIVGCK